ncbi:MAG TPA: Ig-like domain repeat protein [Candidatus Sulfotelmatobacter sp.]|nr:Ig-like domain repeat protein [Candidatus Sulfotelmatobacter sp.]
MKSTLQHRNWISKVRLPARSAALAFAVVLVLAVITTQPAQAQTFNTLYDFCPHGTGSSPVCPDGDTPYGTLVQGTDGNLYGTTSYGGANSGADCWDPAIGCGTFFNITPDGTLTTLYSFCSQTGCRDGSDPFGALVLGTDGNFYGTTFSGGGGCGTQYGCGTFFKVTPSGTLTMLVRFEGDTGAGPLGGLVLGTDGNFYGVTEGYAAGRRISGGTVFKVTPTGTLTTLYNFCTKTGCPDGEYPYAGLIQGTDGNFYGTTSTGGANASGTAFKITPSGTLTTLYNFCTVQQTGTPVVCLDGYYPIAGLVQAHDGNIYGTTDLGGANCNPGGGCGTFFNITPDGTLTTIYSFSDNGGGGPQAALIQATDGNLYGTTEGGPTPTGDGAIFEITTSGTLTTLHAFSGSDGAYPEGAGIVQHTDGNFYGTANYGGSNPDCSSGTVFSLSVGLGPFVETVPTYGPSATAVMILGSDLTGATSVSFNGTAATFTVASATLITTTVPAGATTGRVTVVTPSSGTLTSNLPFTIPAGGATTTTLISSLNPSTFNQSVTFTATVTAADGGTPTGTVTFTADGSNVLGASALSGSGQAVVSTSALTAGTHSIVASYGGDSNDQPSTSTALIQTVQMASSTLSIASNLDPSVYGQAVTFTIYVTPQFGGSATGGVTFYNGTSEIGEAGVSGNKATLTYSALLVGKSGIQGVYSGDSNVAGSTSPVLFQVVTKASTTSAVTSSLNPALVGQTITFIATVTSQHQGTVSGTVDFKSGTLSLGSATLVNGQASIDASFSASGSHSITAKYLGDVNNTGSTSPALKQVVNKYPSSTTLASSLNPSTVGQEVTFTAAVTVTTNGSPTGTVTFKSGTTVLGKVPLTGNIASLSTSALTAGKHSIKAVYSGDGAFKGSTSPTLKQVVNKYPSSTAIVSSLNPSTVGQEVTFTATVTTSGSPTGTVTFKYGTTVLGTGSLTGNTASLSTSSLAAGTYNINAVYSGDGTFKGSTSPALNQVVN